MDFRIKFSVALSLGLLFSMPGHAQDASVAETANGGPALLSTVERYSAGAINSTDVADQALEDVKRERALVEARFAQDEAICYEKFFLTSCMDAAKDRRRDALRQLRSIEVEANAYNRRARVEQRDQALRERQTKQEARASERTTSQNPDDKAGKPATPDTITELESRAKQAAAPDAAPSGKYNSERSAQHAQEQAQQREKELAEVQKREANIRAYEKKQQRSLERQREIAAKREAKEGERTAKAK